MLNYLLAFQPQQSPPNWHYPVHVVPSQATPPPKILHKVWILDCKSCGTFLTNRGMKAVLLLRPNLPLFSTDALPINCSPHSSDAHTLRPPVSSSTPPPRICDCLTQTLCCHGCGNGVGYMIVIPCTRCTSFVTETRRGPNGHRFVLHTNEIVSTERHYIPDEPGVIPYDMPMSPAQPLFRPSSPRPNYVRPYSRQHGTQSSSSSASSIADYPSSPPPEPLELSQTRSPLSDTFPFHPASPQQLRHGPPHPVVPSQSSLFTVEQKEPPSARRLVGGEVLYWHHLARNGEIPGVEEDPRGRCDCAPSAGAIPFDR